MKGKFYFKPILLGGGVSGGGDIVIGGGDSDIAIDDDLTKETTRAFSSDFKESIDSMELFSAPVEPEVSIAPSIDIANEIGEILEDGQISLDEAPSMP